MMALTGHSGMHTAQSMHSSGSMVRKFGPSRKQSTGQTSTQSVYLQRMHDSTTTWVMVCEGLIGNGLRGTRGPPWQRATAAAGRCASVAILRLARGHQIRGLL